MTAPVDPTAGPESLPEATDTPHPSPAEVSVAVAPAAVHKHWSELPDEQLLDVRFSDLGLKIEGSWLQGRIEELNRELAACGLHFRPHYWISAEWFSPDGVPGVAIPFYLAHPRLMKLEKSQMLEVEGGTPEWCMQILRHEAGHAFDNAYALRRRHRRRRVFGSPAVDYPDFYLPKPYSKSFVLHLDSWYAQSHPDEDFAETFAVWMKPDSNWRERYSDWPALRKLEYMDEVMREVGPRPPVVATRRRVEPVEQLKTTLRRHYARKRAHYGLEYPNFYDRDLRRLFSADAAHRRNRKASRFIASIRRDVRRLVAEWTGSYQYTIDRVIEDMITRCDQLGLRLQYPEDRTKLDFTMLLTVQTMNYLHSGRHRVAL
jgi:hypothetical protein